MECNSDKQMPEPKTEEALHFQPEWCRVTLASIGDAVIATDTEGRVTFLNPVAESLTGWTQNEAAGGALESVFKIVNHETRKTVESPTIRAMLDGVIVGLANHTLLIAKDGTERPIDDCAAPIRNERKEVAGAVLVFRDVTERRRQEQHLQDALTYADNIIATMRVRWPRSGGFRRGRDNEPLKGVLHEQEHPRSGQRRCDCAIPEIAIFG